jgi:hypothetical protein
MQRQSLGLLLAAAAAFGIYKYRKMTPEQKNDLRARGKDLLDRKFGLGNLFGKKQVVTDNNSF